MIETISTVDVCTRANLTESALRHVLRRPGAPRPPLHPTARVFLWREEDVEALIKFIGAGGRDRSGSPRANQASSIAQSARSKRQPAESR